MNRRVEASQEGEEKPFVGSAVFGASAEKKTNKQLRSRGNPTSAGPSLLTNQMMELLEGYLEDIAETVTKTVAKGVPLAELASILATSVDTVANSSKK